MRVERRRLSGTRVYCWRGIRLKEEQSLEEQIYEIVNRLCKEDQRGAFVDEVIERVEGYTTREVNAKIDELIEKGFCSLTTGMVLECML